MLCSLHWNFQRPKFQWVFEIPHFQTQFRPYLSTNMIFLYQGLTRPFLFVEGHSTQNELLETFFCSLEWQLRFFFSWVRCFIFDLIFFSNSICQITVVWKFLMSRFGCKEKSSRETCLRKYFNRSEFNWLVFSKGQKRLRFTSTQKSIKLCKMMNNSFTYACFFDNTEYLMVKTIFLWIHTLDGKDDCSKSGVSFSLVFRHVLPI